MPFGAVLETSQMKEETIVSDDSCSE